MVNTFHCPRALVSNVYIISHGEYISLSVSMKKVAGIKEGAQFVVFLERGLLFRENKICGRWHVLHVD
jgi:hypothetical protein